MLQRQELKDYELKSFVQDNEEIDRKYQRVLTEAIDFD